jgi:hypothetical protein
VEGAGGGGRRCSVSEPTNADLIAEARALAEKATPGPWMPFASNPSHPPIINAYHRYEHVGEQVTEHVASVDDATYIAQMRTLGPLLAERLEAAGGRLDHCSKVVSLERQRADALTERLEAAEREYAAQGRSLLASVRKAIALGQEAEAERQRADALAEQRDALLEAARAVDVSFPSSGVPNGASADMAMHALRSAIALAATDAEGGQG